MSGGKGIQLALREGGEYETEDIDVLVYGEVKEEVREEICEIIRWMIGERVSVLEVKESNIKKISYKKLKGGYKAISDIGVILKINEEEMKEKIKGEYLYIYNNRGSELRKKIKDYMLYVKEYIERVKKGEEIKETRRILEKFKKGIIRINKELCKEKGKEEKEEIKKRIEKIGKEEGYDKNIQINTMKMLYPGYIPKLL